MNNPTIDKLRRIRSMITTTQYQSKEADFVNERFYIDVNNDLSRICSDVEALIKKIEDQPLPLFQDV